jgi:glutamate carboxypeptidase
MTELDAPLALSRDDLARAVALLERLLDSSSASGDRAGLARFAALLREELHRRGWEVEVGPPEPGIGDRGEGLPLLRARLGRTPRPLLLIGHFDTVLDAAPLRREPGRLLGTGAIDMKGGVATLFAALDRLATQGRDLPAGLELLLVPDEEVAGPVSHQATAEAGARARALWVLEPGESRGGDVETLVVGRRGLVDWSLDVHGRSAHAGLAFAAGRSAVAAACRWGESAARLSAPPSGPTVNLARCVGGEREFVEKLNEQAGFLFSDRRINVVPDRARIEGELRFLVPEDGRLVVAELEALTSRIAAECDVELDLRFGPLIAPVEPTAARRRYAERAQELAARRGWRL